MRARFASVAVVVVLCGAGLFLWKPWKPRRPTMQPATAPATAPTTAPATRPAPKDFISLVLEHNPSFPTTQPLPIPLDSLNEASRFIFSEPIYLDPAGELWITHADALPVHRQWKQIPKEQVHITSDRVLLAYSIVDDIGKAQPQVIVAREQGAFELLNPRGSIEIGTPGRAYQWDRAIVWSGTIAVPTDTGVSVLRPMSRPMEVFHEFEVGTAASQPATTQAIAKPQVQLMLDWRGLLAWIPWDNGATGGVTAARFVDDQWKTLAHADGWPERIVQLVLLSNGSVVVLSLDDHGLMQSSIVVLEASDVDDKAIIAKVRQLSDEDPKKRDDAFDALVAQGPDIWPALEKLKPLQPPEGQQSIAQLLSVKTRPTLGSMTLHPGKVKVVSRLADAGVLLFAEKGVSLPARKLGDNPQLVAPAWIAIPADESLALAPEALVAKLDPANAHISRLPRTWLVNDAEDGLRMFVGNSFIPLQRKTERQFNHVVGTDARGRWLLQTEPPDGRTMVLDPTLPDATPRLPVWNYPVEKGTVGWTIDDWPVIKAGSAWVIEATGSRVLKPEEQMFEDLREMPSVGSRRAASRPATTQSELGVPILIESDGGQFFDGTEHLIHVRDDGTKADWLLPANATGTAPAILLRAGDKRLFLFNQPGRVLRFRETGNPSSPFELEATFTKNIPSVEHPKRIWLDPAGRIVMSYGDERAPNKLAIMFPTGRIPSEIARQMLGSDLRANDPD